MSIVHDFRVDRTPPHIEPKALVRLRKRGYYYRPYWTGYTTVLLDAGLFQREDAERYAAQIPGMIIEEIT